MNSFIGIMRLEHPAGWIRAHFKSYYNYYYYYYYYLATLGMNNLNHQVTHTDRLYTNGHFINNIINPYNIKKGILNCIREEFKCTHIYEFKVHQIVRMTDKV